MQSSVVNISSWYGQEMKKDYHRKTKNGDISLIKGTLCIDHTKGTSSKG